MFTLEISLYFSLSRDLYRQEGRQYPQRPFLPFAFSVFHICERIEHISLSLSLFCILCVHICQRIKMSLALSLSRDLYRQEGRQYPQRPFLPFAFSVFHICERIEHISLSLSLFCILCVHICQRIKMSLALSLSRDLYGQEGRQYPQSPDPVR